MKPFILMRALFISSLLFLTLSNCTKEQSENHGVHQTVAAKSEENLQALTRLLAESLRPERSFQDLLTELKKTGQKPQVFKESDGFLEDTSLVRTNAPLQGTRYFQAIYENQSGRAVLQHMSFEYRPGEKSMNEAVTAVERAFSHEKKKEAESSDDFVIWSLPEGYVVWVKKMAKEDLIDHPFNAYTPQDVGVVKIAVEKDPF